MIRWGGPTVHYGDPTFALRAASPHTRRPEQPSVCTVGASTTPCRFDLIGTARVLDNSPARVEFRPSYVQVRITPSAKSDAAILGWLSLVTLVWPMQTISTRVG